MKEEVSYREDRDAATAPEQVLADGGGWVSQRDKPFQPSGGPVRIWALFDIPAAPEARRVLIRAGPWERAEYFVFRDGRRVDRQLVGMMVPLRERTTVVTMTPAAWHAGLAAVEVPAGTGLKVVARLASENRFVEIRRLGIGLWEADEIAAGERNDRIVQGIFLGVMLVLVLYNLTLYCLNPGELSYLYYVGGVVLSTLVQATLFGLTFEFLWPGHPQWDFYAMWLGLPVSMWCMVHFVRHYLSAWKHFPRADRALLWVARAGLLLVPAYLLPLAVDRPVNLYLTLVGIVVVFAIAGPLVVGMAALAWRRRHPLSRIFLAAIFSSCAGAFITFGAWFQVLPMVEWVLYASQVGGALTGILLSMGLGLRMRQLHDELTAKQIRDEQVRAEHEREKRALIEEQSRGLEAKVRERTAELAATQAKSEALLANILPQAIIEELKASGQSEPKRHEEVSILFTDFAGFTQTVSTIPPKRLVQELDEIFRGFDDIVAANGLEKIKTIGDAYMAAAGLPVGAGDHAARCVRAGLALARFIDERNRSSALKWGLRVGVHSGAVVAGIVGRDKYAYDVWGDTVNIASRLESAGEAGRVNISAYTCELVRDAFECEYRGKLAAKGKGEIDMYFVVRERTC